jgi:hypothetical protein
MEDTQDFEFIFRSAIGDHVGKSRDRPFSHIVSIDQPSDPRILADDVDCLQNSLANASRGHRIVATYVLAKRLEVADGRPSELDLHRLAVSI